MRRDPLATLSRLRALEVAEARRALAQRQRGVAAAEARAREANAALEGEVAAEAGDFADSFAAWLPQARAACARAAGEMRLAAQAAEVARSALAEVRAAERAVELIREERARVARSDALRRDQTGLDEAAQRAGTGRP
jgi:flagellar biosynthesis chaperone FliJ